MATTNNGIRASKMVLSYDTDTDFYTIYDIKMCNQLKKTSTIIYPKDVIYVPNLKWLDDFEVDKEIQREKRRRRMDEAQDHHHRHQLLLKERKERLFKARYKYIKLKQLAQFDVTLKKKKLLF